MCDDTGPCAPVHPSLHSPRSPTRRPKQKQSRAALAWGTTAPGLNWRTLHRAVRTEHATMAGHGLETNAAAGTIPKEQASVSWHHFPALPAAVRTSQHRFEDDRCIAFKRSQCRVAAAVLRLSHLMSSADFAPLLRNHATTSSARLRLAASRGVRLSQFGIQFRTAPRASRYSATCRCPP